MIEMPASDIFVVIPAYNEARVLSATVAPLLQAHYSVVVVDDCSTDSTWEILRGLPVARIRHCMNLGQGAALQTGMDYALRSGARIVVHFDADGQHDPAQIPAMIEPILAGKVDVVFGSRFLRKSDIQLVSVPKRLLLKAGCVFSWACTGMWLSDTHNGLRALSRQAVSKICLRENGFAHATEILDEVHRNKLPYVEVPTTIRYTDYSRFKGQPASNAFNIAVDLIIRRLFT